MLLILVCCLLESSLDLLITVDYISGFKNWEDIYGIWGSIDLLVFWFLQLCTSTEYCPEVGLVLNIELVYVGNWSSNKVFLFCDLVFILS